MFGRRVRVWGWMPVVLAFFPDIHCLLSWLPKQTMCVGGQRSRIRFEAADRHQNPLDPIAGGGDVHERLNRTQLLAIDVAAKGPSFGGEMWRSGVHRRQGAYGQITGNQVGVSSHSLCEVIGSLANPSLLACSAKAGPFRLKAKALRSTPVPSARPMTTFRTAVPEHPSYMMRVRRWWTPAPGGER